MSIILKGLPVAESIYSNIKQDFGTRDSHPCLAIVQVGNNPASSLYIKKKIEALEALGGTAEMHSFSEDVTEKDLQDRIQDINHNSDIHGILIQLPLPRHLNPAKILSSIDPIKDVDGLTPTNIGLITHGMNATIAATPLAVMKLLEYYNIPLLGKHIVVINNSILFGKPILPLLTHAKATVTICHKNTQNLSRHTQMADIIITATGIPSLITADTISSEVVLIDVGISRREDKVVGDLSPEAMEKAKAYTPVPGGIGPITVACLIDNLYRRSPYQG